MQSEFAKNAKDMIVSLLDLLSEQTEQMIKTILFDNNNLTRELFMEKKARAELEEKLKTIDENRPVYRLTEKWELKYLQALVEAHMRDFQYSPSTYHSIETVKFIRSATGWSLREAKDWVDECIVRAKIDVQSNPDFLNESDNKRD